MPMGSLPSIREENEDGDVQMADESQPPVEIGKVSQAKGVRMADQSASINILSQTSNV